MTHGILPPESHSGDEYKFSPRGFTLVGEEFKAERRNLKGEKLMKKNKMMRIASVLLIAVLLTASVISGTFAKYVTSDNTGDKARVAKFGVVVLGEGNLFGTTYFYADRKVAGNEPNDIYKGDSKNVTVLTVESSNKDNVVAPGTKNEKGMTISVTGTPEVDVLVTFDFELVEEIFLKAKADLPDMTTGNVEDVFENEEDYYPVVFYLGGTLIDNFDLNDELLEGFGFHIVITGDTTWDETGLHGEYVIGGNAAAVAALFNYINNNGEGVYVDANTDLSKAIGTLTLTWAWDFDDNGNGTYDKQDTLLGDLAAGVNLTPAKTVLVDGEDYNLDVEVNFTVTVTQVD